MNFRRLGVRKNKKFSGRVLGAVTYDATLAPGSKSESKRRKPAILLPYTSELGIASNKIFDYALLTCIYIEQHLLRRKENSPGVSARTGSYNTCDQ